MAEMKWMRFGTGKWSAHLFIDGEQACSTAHNNFAFMGKERSPGGPHEVEVGPHGLPYGKVCQWCQKEFNRRRKHGT